MHFLKIVFIGLVILPSLAYAELMSVQVKQTLLRSKPSFVGKTTAKLQYGAQVENEKNEGSWHYVKVLNSKATGWVHESALSKKEIVLNSSQKLSDSSVSQSEVLMAGKGFNKEVEAEYKKQNTNMNYSLVDKVEKSNHITTQQLIRFAKNGKLSI